MPMSCNVDYTYTSAVENFQYSIGDAREWDGSLSFRIDLTFNSPLEMHRIVAHAGEVVNIDALSILHWRYTPSCRC